LLITKSMITYDVEEQISPRILTNLMQNFRNAGEALFEIVDNAVDAADVERRALRIEIEWLPDRVVVVDRGGSGMGLEGLRAFFRWGESAKAGRAGALGRFGQGGKAAIGYLASSFVIVVKAAGERQAYRLADDDYGSRGLATKRYAAEPVDLAVPVDEGYVEIRLTRLNRHRIDARAVALRLSDVYGELIAAGRCTIVLNGETVPAPELPLDRPRTDVAFRLDDGRPVRGWFGRLAPDVAKKGRLRGGLRLCVHGRLITDGEFFGHRGPWFKQSLNQLIGVLELGAVPVNMNKTDFDRDSAEWAQVQARMHDAIAPLVLELSGQREADRVTRSDWRRVRTAQALVEQAIAFLRVDDVLLPEPSARRGAPFPSLLPAPAPAPHRPDRGLLLARSDAGRDAAPAGARRERGARAAVIWEPRAMPEDVRSGWEESAGAPRLLINTHYPLYRAARGDVWYAVETGLFELVRRTRGDELAVDDYYDEVNRIVQQAVELAESGPASADALPAAV
jgi:hypothetical protein